MTATTRARRGDGAIRASLRAALLLFAAGGLSLAAVRAASGPPQILAQPASVVAREGELVSFSVQVDGSEPLAIRWLRDGEPIAGAAGLSLTVGPLILGEDGDSFSVIVTNALGGVTSSNALLTVTHGIVVAASVNRSADLVFCRGWPLILEVVLAHPDALESNAVPLLISATAGPWFNALQVEVRDAQDQSLTWPFHPAPFTNETVPLTGDAGARMLWWLTPEDTAQLPVGDFTLATILNATNVTRPDAWTGRLAGVPVHLAITNEPATLTPVETEQKHRLLAEYALILGDRLQAQREIDALLTAYPTNVGGLTYDVYLKEATGLFDDAFRSVELALDQVALQSPDAPEPPTELLRKEAELAQIVGPPLLEPARVNHEIALSWSGHPGLNYRLETSPDLTAWSLLATNFAVVSNRYSITVELAPARRFFRVAR